MPATLRPDIEKIKSYRGEGRSDARLIAHFELERKLAAQLMGAERSQRARVYGQVYSELFRSLPDHPQHTAKRHEQGNVTGTQVDRLARFMGQGAVFLEVGCGDAAFAIKMAKHVKKSIGVDVTPALIPAQRPENFEFVLTDGLSIDLPSGSVDFIYSDQLMEHLHPEDAVSQLKELRRLLRPGGLYYCSTPNRISGPHDITRYFGYTAEGFHLKEYDYRSLRDIFIESGFKKIKIVLARGSQVMFIPYWSARLVERVVDLLPRPIRASITRNRYMVNLLGVIIVGVS